LLAGKVTKPVVAWVSGTCAKLFKSEVQFGHAGARSGGEEDSAQAKNAALKAAGAIVPESFEGFEEVIRATFDQLVGDGLLTPAPDMEVPEIPMDLATAVKLGKVRKRSQWV
jgi:ATP citrate (pro-S)-lyase